MAVRIEGWLFNDDMIGLYVMGASGRLIKYMKMGDLPFLLAQRPTLVNVSSEDVVSFGKDGRKITFQPIVSSEANMRLAVFRKMPLKELPPYNK